MILFSTAAFGFPKYAFKPLLHFSMTLVTPQSGLEARSRSAVVSSSVRTAFERAQIEAEAANRGPGRG